MTSLVKTTPFTLDNIPYGVISTGDNPSRRCATAFGEYAIDLSKLESDGFFKSISGFKDHVFTQTNLNTFAALPRPVQVEVRKRIIEYLSGDISEESHQKYFIPLYQVANHLPMATANYTDFYCSLEHAQNCSEVAGGQVSPNWYCIPTCYNGRTSSLRISGQPIRRPWGVVQESGPSSQPTWSPSQRLDFELEMGVFLSKAIPAGQVLDIRHAKEHIFGFVLLNDWSARDIQKFEMPPLGPFHSKGFGTTISPWIVTMEALEPVACPRVTQQNPSPLPHLTWKDSAESEIFKIELSAKILRNDKVYHVTSTNLNELYWTPYQQLTYLASAGEGLSTGDILGTGTLSSNRQSPEGEKAGLACLLERMMPKNKMSVLKNEGIEFLEDGDEVVFEGWCYHPKTSRWFGFGECRARVLQALSLEAL